MLYSGFDLDVNGKKCVDVDECKINNAGCSGNCENTVGSFFCSCEVNILEQSILFIYSYNFLNSY